MPLAPKKRKAHHSAFMKRKRSKPTAAGVDEWRGRSFSIESRSLFTKSRFASNKLGKVLNKNKT